MNAHPRPPWRRVLVCCVCRFRAVVFDPCQKRFVCEACGLLEPFQALYRTEEALVLKKAS